MILQGLVLMAGTYTMRGPDHARNYLAGHVGVTAEAPDLITLTATVLLFTGTSSRYYRPEPRPVLPWRGTFGTM
jgi:hypothetical protein